MTNEKKITSTNSVQACQNCKREFIIEPDDFDFYRKIKVPPPTFCPQCRLQRRLAFFNIFSLYKRPCDFCKKEFISTFKAGAPYVVYCPKCWWSDDWDVFEYGRDYDFSRPFFEQFKELWQATPVLGISLDIPAMQTSPYSSHAGHLKNCYLLFHADYMEDSAYGFYLNSCKSVFDSSLIISSERCYDMMHSWRNNGCIGGRSQVTESINCAFLKDSMNCQNCFASANLRNRKYHIFNKPYSKEAYEEKMKQWDLGSYRTYQEVQRRAEEHWATLPPKPTKDEFATNCTGTHVFQSKNCKECFETIGAEDSKYLLMVQNPPIRDSYDISSWGNNMSRCYECCNVGEDVSDVRFCNESGLGLMDADYCKLSTGAHHFGCVSVKKGDYVIMNKRYPKDEYEKLREQIIAHMNEMSYADKSGRVYRYGEFFPTELSPFAYNETIASNFFPLSRDAAEAAGYRYAESEERSYTITKQVSELPDHIGDVEDNILKETIACEACGKGYRIAGMELSFLRSMNVPLPRECPFCRINEKFEQWVKNLRVFQRTCSKCGTEFETNYPKEEVKHILCKKCYQSEVL
ncbi:hypothetical protein LCGC14_1899020 [marine sediment metagenome]|uniref:Zinc-binding domain-containing protein n=1 Tax=marine sediment metagenome TaxID=412755 RepID=A0A0F9FX60_9ZZZZ